MQGMSRGRLEARNIVANILKIVNGIAGGSVMSDAMMHTDVTCKDELKFWTKRTDYGWSFTDNGNIIAIIWGLDGD